MILGNSTASVYLHGDFACFSRPDVSPTRVTYQVPTASSLRNILESIFGKPEFVWIPEKLEVLSEIKTMSFSRNEQKEKISIKQVGNPIDIMHSRSVPRTMVALCNVVYKLEASILIREPESLEDKNCDHVKKYMEMFKRRVSNGQCFRAPYFGCREFTANFSDTKPEVSRPLVISNQQFGVMLLENYCTEEEQFRCTTPITMTNGIIEYPKQELVDFWKGVTYATRKSS